MDDDFVLPFLAPRHVVLQRFGSSGEGLPPRGRLRSIAHCGVKEAAMEGQQRPPYPLAHCELGIRRSGYRTGDCKL